MQKMNNVTIEQEMPNMKAPFEDVEQKVRITTIKVDFQIEDNPIQGLPQVILDYEIIRTKNEINVTTSFKSKVDSKVFNNDMKLYKRSFEQETLFQPVQNPDFISVEETPDVEQFLTVGAFDFVIGDLAINNGAFLVPFLKMYITDNYADGWFESNI